MRISNKKYLSNKKVLSKSKLNSMAKGGKPSQITVLAKAVKALQNKNKQESVYLNFGDQFDTTLSSDVNIFPLSRFTAWNPIFGSSANDVLGNKTIHKSFGLDMYLNSNNETDTIQFTIFLVSLKDNIRGGAFNASSGALSLTSGTDYYIQNGLAMLNKASFNIHHVKRCVLGNNGVGLGSSTAQNQYGTDRRYYIKQRCNKVIQTAGSGDWKTLSCSQDPSDNYYLLIFNDNGILDAENPRVRINTVHTVQQLA